MWRGLLSGMTGRPCAHSYSPSSSSSTVSAQEPDTLAAEDGWRSELVASLTGNQSSFSNWQEGGVDALGGHVVRRRLVRPRVRPRAHDPDAAARARRACARTRSTCARRSTSIRYEVTAERTGGPVRPAVSASVRTQFAAGFDYSPTAEEYPALEVVPGQELKVSDALAPLVLTQTVGLAYRPGGGFVGRAGLGNQGDRRRDRAAAAGLRQRPRQCRPRRGRLGRRARARAAAHGQRDAPKSRLARRSSRSARSLATRPTSCSRTSCCSTSTTSSR